MGENLLTPTKAAISLLRQGGVLDCADAFTHAQTSRKLAAVLQHWPVTVILLGSLKTVVPSGILEKRRGPGSKVALLSKFCDATLVAWRQRLTGQHMRRVKGALMVALTLSERLAYIHSAGKKRPLSEKQTNDVLQVMRNYLKQKDYDSAVVVGVEKAITHLKSNRRLEALELLSWFAAFVSFFAGMFLHRSIFSLQKQWSLQKKKKM